VFWVTAEEWNSETVDDFWEGEELNVNGREFRDEDMKDKLLFTSIA